MKTEVLIIGAGPYGISLAYDLHCRNIPFQIAGIPFSLWFNHILSSVSLRSDFRASTVYSRDGRFDLIRFLKESYAAPRVKKIVSGRIPVAVFREYLNWVLSRLPFPIHKEKVMRLEKSNGGFLAVTESGKKIAARKTVLATGIENHRRLPECLESLGKEKVHHGWDVPAYENLRGKNLLVVGGGQSAAEAAVWLSRENGVDWVYRSPLVFFSEPINLPKPLFNAALRLSPLFYFFPRGFSRIIGKKFLQATITPDLKPDLTGGKIRQVNKDAAELRLKPSNGVVHSEVLNKSFDRVIACTGYSHDLKTLSFLTEELRGQIDSRGGVPVLKKNYAASVPGLFIIGGMAEPSHGPAQRFMFGCRDATLKAGKALSS